MRYPHGVLARAWQAPSRWLRVWSSSWAAQIADLGAVTAGRRLDELAQMICARVLARCAYSDVREIGSSGVNGSSIRRMLRLVRFVLLVVMTLLTLSFVIAVGTPETGPLEKAVAALAVVALVAAAGPVRRIGSAS
jgi:hypothetical protein